MKDWFLSTELLGIDGMPNSLTGIGQKARRNNWLSRKASGKGRSMEYHISNFHFDVQKELYEKYASKSDIEHLGREFTVETKAFFSSMADEEINTRLQLEAGVYDDENHAQFDDMGFEDPFLRTENLKVFTVRDAASAGNLYSSEINTSTLPVSVCLLQDISMTPNATSIVIVSDNSMKPTLTIGEKILVDNTEPQHPVVDGVYVIRIDQEVYIKRLLWNIQNAAYEIISDNPAHKNFEIPRENTRNFKIMGKVIASLAKRIR
ncbi:helix-turn-helix domain-containing protein [Vibrio maritimus]|uniref:helix-turn-helix domain-containing protein n=1 Tax=Vibrio maritimus TaxID=990268 RepID=UPI004067E103